MPIMSSFPNCCTAEILCALGGTALSVMYRDSMSEEAIINYIKENVDRGKCCVAITNSDQKNANSTLKKCGFKYSSWMKKQQHPETKIRLWWLEPES